MSKKKLQAEIKAMQKYREEAKELIEKINISTKETNKEIKEEIKRIKKQIEEDLNELVQYTSKEVPCTITINVYKYIEKDEEGYPKAHFEIQFGRKQYGIADTNPIECKIAIVEKFSSYAPVYGDGLWADDYPETAKKRRWGKSNSINEVIEILCRNWDSIINGAYEEIKKAYKEKTEYQIKEALKKQEETILRHETLSNV